MSRDDDLALLHDIERHDYAHIPEDDDLIKVRVTLDVVVSRSGMDADWETGTDPQMVRDAVSRLIRNVIEPEAGLVVARNFRSVRPIQFAAVAAVRRMRLTRRR